MKEIRLKLADIFEVEPERTDRPKDIAAITAYVLKHYAFLRRTEDASAAATFAERFSIE